MQLITIAESIAGASHVRIGKPCQDANAHESWKDGFAVVAVADGHGSGSSPYSADGAAAAVNVFCKYMKVLCKSYQSELDRLFFLLKEEGDIQVSRRIKLLWEDAIKDIHRHNKRNESIDDHKALDVLYGTTLLGLLITPVFHFVLQIGDGNITIVDNGLPRIAVDAPHLLGTETYSLSLENVERYCHTSLFRMFGKKDFQYILSTDGFYNSFPSEADYLNACTEYISMIKEYGYLIFNSALPGWLNETSKQGCGDDITFSVTFCEHVFKPITQNSRKKKLIRRGLYQKQNKCK